MKKLVIILTVLAFNIVASANATIISGNHTTSSGKIVNLQGLEWLSLDVTKGMSRSQIESGVGGFINNGWRYASRSETSNLINSLWGNLYDGFSPDNYDGAKWFLSNFSALDSTSSNINTSSSPLGGVHLSTFHKISSFFFGNDGECSNDTTFSCYGTITTQRKLVDVVSVYKTNALHTIWTVETKSYQYKKLGSIREEYGADFGRTQENKVKSKDFSFNSYGSLLVREQPTTNIPEPSSILLLTLGFSHLWIIRRKTYRKAVTDFTNRI